MEKNDKTAIISASRHVGHHVPPANGLRAWRNKTFFHDVHYVIFETMKTALRQKVWVQLDSVIQIHSPELKSGSNAEMDSAEEKSLSALIGSAHGGFASPQKAHACIQRERDAGLS